MSITTISPNDPAYYVDHDTETLRRIVDKYTDDSATIAITHGADHPMSMEALAISMAAWGALVLRGEAMETIFLTMEAEEG